MKHLIIPLLLVGGFVALTPTEASAVVCAAGVHRAGCVGAGSTDIPTISARTFCRVRVIDVQAGCRERYPSDS
jgi:hypothetical protein